VQRDRNARGIWLMVAAMGCFITNDAIIKQVSETLPAAQLIFIRGVMASLLVLAVARVTSVPIRPSELRHPWVAGRACVDALATFGYLLSLFHLPIANATAINMAAPLFIAALAVPMLGERVDARRWMAIGVGFAGVLLIVQPRAEGFNGYALLCLGATFMHALRDLATRRIPRTTPSLAITFATSITVTVIAGVVTLLQGWVDPPPASLAWLALTSVFLALAYHLIVASTRTGDLSAIAPFRYSGLLFALVLGWAIWGDVPDVMAWCGIALLIGAGLDLLARERARRA
jgi:drug/metabolite transporter (DMT)-like permease